MAAIALPTGRPGHVLALGLTVLLLALLWLGAAEPLLGWYADRQATLDQRIALVRRMTELSATLPALRAQAGHPETDPAPAASTILAGDSDAVAGAQLAQSVQALVGQAGATLASTDTLPAVAAGAYRRIGVHVAMSARWPTVIGLLRALDRATPHMLVDDLQLRGPGLAVQPAEPELQVSFSVTAFRAATP